MTPWTMIALGFVIAAIGLAWGLIMLLAPRKFAELARVQWLPDVFNVRRKGVRIELRIMGLLTTIIALYFIYLLVVSTHHLLEGQT